MGEVRALGAPGSNLGGRGGHLRAGRGFEWWAPRPNRGPGAGPSEGSRVRERLPGRGTGGLLRGDAAPRLRKPGVPGLGETETTPRVPEPEQGCKGRETLEAPKRGGGGRGRRPGRLSCPEPGGLCPRHPLLRLRTLPLPPPPGRHIPRAPPRGPASPRRCGPWTTGMLLSCRTQEPAPAPAPLRNEHRPPRPP